MSERHDAKNEATENAPKARARRPRNPDAAKKFFQSSTVKFFLLGFLSFLLTIPLFMIDDLIREREQRRDSVQQEIASAWGKEQFLFGPVLSIPMEKSSVVTKYNKKLKQEESETVITHDTLNLLPKDLEIQVKLKPELRNRSIYEVVVYRADVNVKGQFQLDTEALKRIVPEGYKLQKEKTTLSLSFSDMKGLQGQPKAQWLEKELSFLPGTGQQSLLDNGIHAPVSLKPDGDAMPFRMALSLHGTEEFLGLPAGEHSLVKINGDWHSPSFSGAFLPGTRSVNNERFEGEWDLSYFARSFPQAWLNSQNNTIKNHNYRPAWEQGKIAESTLGVSLIQPVDFYSLSDRAIKYGFLFLFFTFGTYFLFEATTKSQYHPVQYALVGLALCLFFLLLIALSEHIGFTLAYCTAALSTIGLIAGYTYSITPKEKRQFNAGILSCILVLLYSYLYTLLHLEDYSLLIGSVGLFIALAFVMFVSRKVQWYSAATED